MSQFDSEIIHFAGPVCTYGSVARQRCQWCGALIQERDIAAMAVSEAGRESGRRGEPLDFDEIGHWEGLVAVSGAYPRVLWAVESEPSEEDGYSRAPDRSCMRLFEGLESHE